MLLTKIYLYNFMITNLTKHVNQHWRLGRKYVHIVTDHWLSIKWNGKWFDNIFLNLLFQVQHLVFRIYLYCTNLCNAICLWTNRLCALGKINSWWRTCCPTWFGCSEKTYCETKCKFSVQTRLIFNLKFTWLIINIG